MFKMEDTFVLCKGTLSSKNSKISDVSMTFPNGILTAVLPSISTTTAFAESDSSKSPHVGLFKGKSSKAETLFRMEIDSK